MSIVNSFSLILSVLRIGFTGPKVVSLIGPRNLTINRRKYPSPIGPSKNVYLLMKYLFLVDFFQKKNYSSIININIIIHEFHHNHWPDFDC